MTSETHQVVVTGIKPTGRPHLGNYLGMIRPALSLAERHSAYVFVADAHAMTTVGDPEELAALTREVAATLLALGLEPARTALYRQSDVPEVFELAWTLACSTPKGLLNRAHAYKAAVEANEQAGRPGDDGVSAGLFTYPVLMAADILAVDGELVPVGRDQAQHLEVTRDITRAFNRAYGAVLVVPEAAIDSAVATVAGTDGRKMSKSYDNVLPLFGEPTEVARRVRSMVTDSRAPQEPKDPDTCPIYALYRHVVRQDQADELAARYRAGGVGYGEAKALLVAAFEVCFGQARLRYQSLLADKEGLDVVLADGAQRARARATNVLARVRRARGIGA